MKVKNLTLAAVATMLAACSSNDEIVTQDILKDTPITVHAAVAELTSRAGYEGTTTVPEQFYITIDQTGTAYDYTNVLMKKVDGTWKAYEGETEKTLLWADGTTNVNVTAATFSLDGAQTLVAKADQSTADNVKASDHLYMASKSVTPSDAGISVELSHIMSKVILTITLGDEFNSETNPITGVTFKGTVASNTYDAGTWGTIATDAETTDIIALAGTYTAPTNSAPNATAQYEVILVPQEVETGCFAVQFNVGSRVYRWISEKAVTLASGTQYTLALTAGKDNVSGATFTTTAWSGNNNLSGETE